MITILKNTTKLVTDVPFPALTLCGSGVHMNIVEKKLVRDFKDWRAQNKKTRTDKEAIKNDLGEFMDTRFQIKPNQPGSINILDILDMMIAPDVDASIAANSIRENEIACRQASPDKDYESGCSYSCSHPWFTVLGTQCLYVNSTSTNTRWGSKANCQSMGADLASIHNVEEDNWIRSQVGGNTWIGIYKREDTGKWTHPDGTTDTLYENWGANQPRGTDSRCAAKMEDEDGKWDDVKSCDTKWKYACSAKAQEACDSNEALQKMLRRRACITPEANKHINLTQKLPAIDIFLNPAREQAKKRLLEEKKDIAKGYFKNSDMQTLFPELFRILWESTLPCFKEENKDEHMLLACELAGVEVNCSDIFTRVPTDTGICCVLNVDDSLQGSEYQDLVAEMQGNNKPKKVRSQEGAKNGLRLTLDLHSNTVSLGTLDQQHNAFKLFVGEPSQFPKMLDKGIPLQPGREHFVDLSATVVTTSGIKGISPEDRGCLFTDESELEFYKSYTFSNCRLECGIKNAEEIHNCIPWHLPKVNSSSG